MIQEQYVSFETAKLLKEKGFEGECSRFYMPNGNGRWKYEHYHDFDISERIECPTLQMAMKWLDEMHYKFIVVDKQFFVIDKISHIASGFTYSYEIKHINTIHKEAGFRSPEEACESAIKYCLENLI